MRTHCSVRRSGPTPSRGSTRRFPAYVSAASRPTRGHPGGEEILVVEGTFSDETGDHPPGTYQLNPEGFVHTPRSRDGCFTFVKLRQHGGAARARVRVNIHEDLEWQRTKRAGVSIKPLYRQSGFAERTWVERRDAGSPPVNIGDARVHEVFVIEGTWSDPYGDHSRGSWLRYIPKERVRKWTMDGCTVYRKSYPDHAAARPFIVGHDFRHPNGAGAS